MSDNRTKRTSFEMIDDAAREILRKELGFDCFKAVAVISRKHKDIGRQMTKLIDAALSREKELVKIIEAENEQAAEFNAGFEAYGIDLKPEDEPSGYKHNQWRVGYALAGFDDLCKKYQFGEKTNDR